MRTTSNVLARFVAIGLALSLALGAGCSRRATSSASPESALTAFVRAHPETVVHSEPVSVSGGHTVAVVGLALGARVPVIDVVDLRKSAVELAQLQLPEPAFDLAADHPVQVADVTGDGRADFLVRVVAGDTIPGVVVSDDGGRWRVLAISPNPMDVYIGRDPHIDGGRLLSTTDDCAPTCASGHTTITSWRYSRASGQLSHS